MFGGIEFPHGTASFADQVVRHDPLFGGGPAPTEPAAIDPAVALGAPDFPAGGSVGDVGAVALGHGGLLELGFVDNWLTNSGNSDGDLYIFEVGPDIEDTFVAVRPTAATLLLLNLAWDANGDGFYEVGKVFGATAEVDLDAHFPGFAAGALEFDAVQLIDDPDQGNTTGPTVGADIDAVGAISSVPEPSSLMGCVVAGAMLTLRWRNAARLSRG